MAKKRYRLILDVISVAGTQEYWVEAKSPSDALKRFKKEGGELIWEELEVTSLSEPCLNCITEVEDDEEREGSE